MFNNLIILQFFVDTYGDTKVKEAFNTLKHYCLKYDELKLSYDELRIEYAELVNTFKSYRTRLFL